MLAKLKWFFGSKRRLLELNADIAAALAHPTFEQRHRAIGEILRKHGRLP